MWVVFLRANREVQVLSTGVACGKWMEVGRGPFHAFKSVCNSAVNASLWPSTWAKSLPPKKRNTLIWLCGNRCVQQAPTFASNSLFPITPNVAKGLTYYHLPHPPGRQGGAFSWGTLGGAFSSPPTKANKGRAFSSMAQQATRWWRSDHTTSINGPAKRTCKWHTKDLIASYCNVNSTKDLAIFIVLMRKT